MSPSIATAPAMLPEPSPDFNRLDIKAKYVLPSRLLRSGPRNSGEPYFGKLASYRFDDPDKSYGTCYLGFDLPTALAETLLHDMEPVNGMFKVSRSRFDSRWIIRFADVPGQPLKLADLTGTSLLRAGGNGALSSIIPYDVPQRWSQAVHAHPGNFDGIHYVSRKLNHRRAVVLFDKRTTRAKIGTATYTALPRVTNIGRVKKALGIRVIP